jgi:hypothetical protein
MTYTSDSAADVEPRRGRTESEGEFGLSLRDRTMRCVSSLINYGNLGKLSVLKNKSQIRNSGCDRSCKDWDQWENRRPN